MRRKPSRFWGIESLEMRVRVAFFPCLGPQSSLKSCNWPRETKNRFFRTLRHSNQFLPLFTGFSYTTALSMSRISLRGAGLLIFNLQLVHHLLHVWN